MKRPRRRFHTRVPIRDPAQAAGIQRAEATMAQAGWFIQGVMAETQWHYTIGLTRFELPEMMLVGNFPPFFAGGLLNMIAHRMHVHQHRFDDGTISKDIFENMSVLFREIAPSELEQRCGKLLEFCGESARVIHMLLPDRHGVMPWEAECEVACQLDLRLTYKVDRPLSLWVN
jgi:Domain of unknown function (DUF4262)